jgi:hypothetical protein
VTKKKINFIRLTPGQLADGQSDEEDKLKRKISSCFGEKRLRKTTFGITNKTRHSASNNIQHKGRALL